MRCCTCFEIMPIIRCCTLLPNCVKLYGDVRFFSITDWAITLEAISVHFHCVKSIHELEFGSCLFHSLTLTLLDGNVRTLPKALGLESLLVHMCTESSPLYCMSALSFLLYLIKYDLE